MNCDLIQRLTFAKEAAKYFSNNSHFSSFRRREPFNSLNEKKNMNVLDLTEHQNLLRNFPKYFPF